MTATKKLDGKLDTEEVTIIGNDPQSNVKQPKFPKMTCYDCGHKFGTDNKDATICPACVKLYIKKPSLTINSYTPQKSEGIGIGQIFVYLLFGGIGLFVLISFIMILKGCLGILGS